MTFRIDREKWDLSDAKRAEETATGRGLAAGLEAFRKRAAEHVPYNTGALAASEEVTLNGDTATLGYGAPHAGILNAHPEWHYQGGRSGHWLEEAAEDGATEIGGALADGFRDGWPGQ